MKIWKTQKTTAMPCKDERRTLDVDVKCFEQKVAVSHEMFWIKAHKYGNALHIEEFS